MSKVMFVGAMMAIEKLAQQGSRRAGKQGSKFEGNNNEGEKEENGLREL